MLCAFKIFFKICFAVGGPIYVTPDDIISYEHVYRLRNGTVLTLNGRVEDGLELLQAANVLEPSTIEPNTSSMEATSAAADAISSEQLSPIEGDRSFDYMDYIVEDIEDA